MQNAEGLGERKLKILHAIIQTYLETGEPVGSRTNIQIYGFEFKFCDDPK